jgi:hypothetical protein
MSDMGRVKIVGMDERLLIDIFNWHRNPPHFLALPVTSEIPADAKVLRVYTNHERRTIDAVIHSESFPRLAIGSQVPRIEDCITEFRTIGFDSLVTADNQKT